MRQSASVSQWVTAGAGAGAAGSWPAAAAVLLLAAALLAPPVRGRSAGSGSGSELAAGCSQASSGFADCVRNTTEALRPHLAAGPLPRTGLPPLEPLSVPLVLLRQSTEALCYRLLLQDLSVAGLARYSVAGVRLERGSEQLSVRLQLPRLQLAARFSLSGQLRGTQLHGAGRLGANFTDSELTLTLPLPLSPTPELEPETETVAEAALAIGEAMLTFHNTAGPGPEHDGNSTMVTNMFLNENTNEIIDELRPALEAVIAMYAGDLAGALARLAPRHDAKKPRHMSKL